MAETTVVNGAGTSTPSSTSTTTYLIPQGQLLSFNRDGATYQVHSDALGSVRMVTDVNGNVVFRQDYDAWGNRLGTTGTLDFTPYQFVGAYGVRNENSSHGLYLMNQRWYDPQLGRFLNRDPIGFNGGLNLFGYVYQSPLMFMDPSGLLTVSVTNDLMNQLKKMGNNPGKFILNCVTRALSILQGVKNHPPCGSPVALVQDISKDLIRIVSDSVYDLDSDPPSPDTAADTTTQYAPINLTQKVIVQPPPPRP